MCRSLIRLELLSSFVEPNTLQCFRLDLTDTFTRDAEFAADFFESEADAFVGEAVAHFEDFALFRGQFVEDGAHLLGENAAGGVHVGAGDRLVGDK